MSAHSLTIVVHGMPAPQGSKRHVGHGVLVESSAKVKPWRVSVAMAAEVAASRAGFRPERAAPYSLDLVLTLPRPSSHWRTGRNAGMLRDGAPQAPATLPDLDKLVRSTLDGLADGGVLENDSRVVHIGADKVYPAGHLDALDSPGAVIVLRRGVS